MATEKVETVPETAPPATAAEKSKKGAISKAKPVVAGAASAAKKKKKKNKGKKGQPGKYSQLVIDAIRTLGEKNGSSLFKIYKEAKKTSWFDQQNGRMYLRYSIRALLLNDTLIQVKGSGANGSFKLNKKKFEKAAAKKKSASKPTKTAKPAKAAKPAKKPSSKKASKPAAKASPKKKVAKKSAVSKKPAAVKTAPKAKKAAVKKAPSAKKTKKAKK